MKKFFIVMLLAIMAVILSACSGSEKMEENPGFNPGPTILEEIVITEIVIEEIQITPIVIG